MNPNKLYFYRKTVHPDAKNKNCRYFNYQKGVAGYRQPEQGMELLLYGTQEELQEYLDNNRRRVRLSAEPRP